MYNIISVILYQINETYNICNLMAFFHEYTCHYFATSGLHIEIWVTAALTFSLALTIEFPTLQGSLSQADYVSLSHITYVK